MRVLVRTVAGVPDRAANVERLRSHLPELEVVTDHVRDSYASFREACAELADTGGLLLEDDVALCTDFRAQVRAVLDTVGWDQVVNFFEKPRVWFAPGFAPGSSFLWMQCLYLPAGFAGRIYDHYEEFRTTRPRDWQGMATDCLVAYALVRERRRYYRHRPCLVQHLPLPSLIGPRPTNRQTPYFLDDLVAQGVTYDDLRPAQ